MDEKREKSISSKFFSHGVIDIIALDILRLLAIGTQDKFIYMYNYFNNQFITKINLQKGGLHTIVYSAAYQTLITGGYENRIRVWTVNPKFFDYSQAGCLIGHSSMVTSVAKIEKTPMIVSIDDTGIIKIWDIRDLNCI